MQYLHPPNHAPPPNRQSSLPRNESVGAGTTATDATSATITSNANSTALTSESEPLLGERLLLGNYDNDEEEGEKEEFVGDIKLDSDGSHTDIIGRGAGKGARGTHHHHHHRNLLSQDASTIEKEGSDRELNEDEEDDDYGDGEHTRSFMRGPWSSSSSLNKAKDPHIGLNVVTNEFDTLAYSRDPDDSTLLTNDYFGRRHTNSLRGDDDDYGEDGDNGGDRGGFWSYLWYWGDGWPSKQQVMSGPSYYLICLGLAVGVGLCSILALVYMEYSKWKGLNILPRGGGTGVSGNG